MSGRKQWSWNRAQSWNEAESLLNWAHWLHHTLSRYCKSVLRMTTKVNGKVENSTPAPPETPEPIVTKICVGNYGANIYHYAKFHHDTITQFRPPNMRTCASSDSASFLVLPTAYSQDPCTDFHDQHVKRRGFAQGCSFWGVPKTKFYISTPFFPKNTNFCQYSTGQHFASKRP